MGVGFVPQTNGKQANGRREAVIAEGQERMNAILRSLWDAGYAAGRSDAMNKDKELADLTTTVRG
jgi:hypothetical protein